MGNRELNEDLRCASSEMSRAKISSNERNALPSRRTISSVKQKPRARGRFRFPRWT